MMVNEIKTETVRDCLLCKCDRKPVYSGLRDRLYSIPGQWSHSRCACGLVYLNPRPVLEDIPKCYPNDYFTHAATVFPSLGASSTTKLLRLMALSSYLGYKHLQPNLWYSSLVGKLLMFAPFWRNKVTMGLGARLPYYRQGGRLLDVGCGNGFYLALMKELGWEVAGVELDPKAAEIARSRFGIVVHQGSLDNAPFEQGSFDVVTMSHVIEHVPNPISFTQTAARFLKSGGQMVIVTPNVQSLGHKLFRQNWYPLDPPRHLILFTPATIKQCLLKTGGFQQIVTLTNSRKTQKVLRKFFLVRQTESFLHESEKELNHKLWFKLTGKFLDLIEKLGNPIFQWGEEIECIAKKA